MIKRIEDYTDSLNLICHRMADGRFEGGDAPQRSGMYYSLNTDYIGRMKYETALSFIQVKPGYFIRHPNSTETWHADPKEFSRDQQTPTIIAAGLHGFKKLIFRTFIRHLLRGGKYQNKDFGWPIGIYIRALRFYPFWPLLLLSDLWLFGGVVMRCYQAKKNQDDVGDDLNLIMELYQALKVMPTPISALARRYYSRNRPPNFGNTMLMLFWPIRGALAWYFRPDSAPPLDKVWNETIFKYFLPKGVE